MQMGMDYVRLELRCGALDCERERHIEVELVPGRPHHHALLPGYIYRAPGGDSMDVIARMVRAEEDIVASGLKVDRLFKDADVRSIVREK
jgi:hypothetical protein